MPPRLITWLLALAGAALVLYIGTPTEDVYWSDFNVEAWPAFERLIAGEPGAFLSLGPLGYGGSMICARRSPPWQARSASNSPACTARSRFRA